MAYTVDTTKTHLPEAVELLADAVLNPKYDLHVVKDTARRAPAAAAAAAGIRAGRGAGGGRRVCGGVV